MECITSLKSLRKVAILTGTFDTQSKQYMSDPVHFADVMYFFFFDGDQVVQASDLRELDPTEIALVYGNNAKVPIQKVRDVIKSWTAMYDGNAIYLVLGIENQSKIHYAMVVKNMVYDSLHYAKQVMEATKSHKGEKLSGDEFLSGFTKEDKLIPVITLVLYFGAEEWDGATNLHKMFEIQDERILKYVPDYKINLIQPAKISKEEFQKFRTELGKVLEYIKLSKNKSVLHKQIQQEAEFWKLHKESFDLLNTATNSKLKLFLDEGGRADMCVAIDEMRQDMEIVGFIKGRRVDGISLEEAIKDAALMYGKTEEYVKEVYEEEVA